MSATALAIVPTASPAYLNVDSVDPAALTGAIKAVREFVSKDLTRFVLTHVYAERVAQGFASSGPKLRLTASDGHTLCRVEIPAELNGAESAFLDAIALDRILLDAKQAKGRTAVAFRLDAYNPDKLSFPEVERVIPKRAEPGSSVPGMAGFNGLYLARIGAVQKALKASTAVLTFGTGEHAPLRADVRSVDTDTSAIVVVMPMRV